MPLTIAHPAAVLPLHRWLAPRTVPSALVIGSLAPDLAYFLPLGVVRSESHSVSALFWFCLPAGAALYLVFHLLLKRPLLSLAPVALSRRLAGVPSVAPGLPSAGWTGVLTSIFLGATTHLAWDAFTHATSPAVRAFGFLRTPLLAIGSYEVMPYTILQHGSTLVGIVVLAWWIRRWWDASAVGPAAEGLSPSMLRVAGISLLLAIPLVYGLAVALGSTATMTIATFRIAVARGVIASFSAFGVLMLAYSLSWHLWFQARSRRRG